MNNQTAHFPVLSLENGSLSCFTDVYLIFSTDLKSKVVKATIFSSSFSSSSKNNPVTLQSQSNQQEMFILSKLSTPGPRPKLFGIARFIPPTLNPATPKPPQESVIYSTNKEPSEIAINQSMKKPETPSVSSSSAYPSVNRSIPEASMDTVPSASLSSSTLPIASSPLQSSSSFPTPSLRFFLSFHL